MCFQHRQSKEAVKLENRFNTKFETVGYQSQELYKGYDFPKTPVITNTNPELIQMYNWGLIPSFSTNKSRREFTLNARVETLNEKESFKDVMNNRCLIIVDGFYEWQWLTKTGNKKQKYIITLPDNGLFCFAGLYDRWLDTYTNEVVHSYTIVTTTANKLMSEIHNHGQRMPIILRPEQEKNWLNSDEFFVDYNIDLLATPIDKPLTTQGSLFS
jgi:putative SOS response-associated peptidase YedK